MMCPLYLYRNVNPNLRITTKQDNCDNCIQYLSLSVVVVDVCTRHVCCCFSQKCIATASQPEDVTTLPVYLAILRGLERLLLANVLTSDDAETLMKLSVDR